MTMAEPQSAASSPNICWYHLTPDRFVIGLLVAECLLWLSGRLRWFGFNEHKGWTVLIGMAVLGATILLMLVWFVASLLIRIRFQFGIRSLLLLPVAVGVLCSWLVAEINESRREQETEAVLTKAGRMQWSESPEPIWLWNLLGIDICKTVWRAEILGDQVTDSDLEHIEDLSHLVVLELGETKITDAGLEHIEGLSQLRTLDLTGTKATAEGVKKLQQALPNCTIKR